MTNAEKTQSYIDKLEAIEDKPGYKLHDDNVEIVSSKKNGVTVWLTDCKDKRVKTNKVFGTPFINDDYFRCDLIKNISRCLPNKPPLIKTTIMTSIEYSYLKSKGFIRYNKYFGKRIIISKLMPVNELKILSEDELQKMGEFDIQEYIGDLYFEIDAARDILKHKVGGE